MSDTTNDRFVDHGHDLKRMEKGDEVFNAAAHLPARIGARPKSTPQTPHVQLDQWSPEALQTQLLALMGSLAHVRIGASNISAHTSIAFHLAANHATGPVEAFLARTEFAHVHGDGSGSLHLTLPMATVDEVIRQGWGEPHPAAVAGFAPPTLTLLYGPRDRAELQVVWALVQQSYDFASSRR